jgi:hypothetical protein
MIMIVFSVAYGWPVALMLLHCRQPHAIAHGWSFVACAIDVLRSAGAHCANVFC